jgi:hypothetical protein
MDVENLRAESCAGDEEGLVVRTVGVQVPIALAACSDPPYCISKFCQSCIFGSLSEFSD